MLKKRFALFLLAVATAGSNVVMPLQNSVYTYAQMAEVPEDITAEADKIKVQSTEERVESLEFLKLFDPSDLINITLTSQQEAEIRAVVEEIIKDKTEDAQKAKAITQWITSNVKYTADISQNISADPYDVFVDKKAVCGGFSNLLNEMLAIAEIPSVVVIGNYYGNLAVGQAHQWNAAYVDNKWVFCDSTGNLFDTDNMYKTHEAIQIMGAEISYEGLKLGYYNGLAVISSDSPNVIIPDEYQGYPIHSLSYSLFSVGSKIESIYINANITYIEESTLRSNTTIKAIEVSPENEVYSSHQGALFNKDKSQMLVYPMASDNKEFTFPGNMTSFDEKNGVNSITLENIYVEEGNTKYSSYEGVLYNADKTSVIFVPQAKKRVIIYENASVSLSAFPYFYSTGMGSYTIVGKKGSPAEQFALTNNIKFEEFKEEVVKEVPEQASFDLVLPEKLVYEKDILFEAIVKVKDEINGMGQIKAIKYNGQEEIPQNAGIYEISIDVEEGEMYTAVTDLYIGTMAIDQKEVEPPKLSSMEYTGEKLVPVIEEAAAYQVKENQGGTEPGEYTVILELKDITNYRWKDNEGLECTITYKIIDSREPEGSEPEEPGENEPDSPEYIVPDGIWVEEFETPKYTGDKITPQIKIYDKEKLLREKTDYTITYKNNKNAYTYDPKDYEAFEEVLKTEGKRSKAGSFDPAKAPQIIIKMKGDYTGTEILYYEILPVSISANEMVAVNPSAVWNGKQQLSKPVMNWQGKNLKYGKDYVVLEYEEAKGNETLFTEGNEYKITVQGKGNFDGKRQLTFTISRDKMQASMAQVAVKGVKNQDWSGKEVIQTSLIVTYKGVELREGADYTITYENNIEAGTAVLLLNGTGKDEDGDGLSFIGSKAVFFKIQGQNLKKAKPQGLASSYTYTGSEIEPFTVSENKTEEAATLFISNMGSIPSRELMEGRDFTVTYEKNIGKGTAIAHICPLPGSGLEGTQKISFKIGAASVDALEVQYEAKDMINLSVSINDGIYFKEGKRIKDGIYNAPYTKGSTTPEVILKANGRILTQGKDYTVSYKNNKKPASAADSKSPQIIIKGKGDYTGSKSIYFTIVEKNFTSEDGLYLEAKDKVYTEKAGSWKQNFQVYDANGKALAANEYDKNSIVYTLIASPDENVELPKILSSADVCLPGSVIQISVKAKENYKEGTLVGEYRILNTGFDISKAVIKIKNQSFTGEEIFITSNNQLEEGKVFLKDNGTVLPLELNKHFRIVKGSYEKNKAKGTAKVTVEGIGEYGGSKVLTFKITPRPVNEFWQGTW